MAFLRDISDKFWNYVSPRKTQQRRDKDFKFKVPPLPQQSRKGSSKQDGEPSTGEMSPETRVQNWTVRSPSLSGSDSIDGLSPSPPTSLGRAYTDMEGDTLIDQIAEEMNPDSEEDWDANEETILIDEGRYIDEHKAVDAEHERERREAQGRELRAAGWTEDAIFLFQKLGMRGFEPILPWGWVNDFSVIPLDMFTKNEDKTFIRPISGSDAHAQKALTDLFEVGGRVRDAVLQKAPLRTAEVHIRRAVLKYNGWALRDGDIERRWKDLSLFATVSAHKGTRSDRMEQKMIRKLKKLGMLWEDAFQARAKQDKNTKSKKPRSSDTTPVIPTLYGVLSSHTIMAFVSYDPLAETPILRTVAMFDFGQEGYDVWNSLAIAIFIIHCRNRLMELQEWLPEPEEEPTESDPDA